MLPVSGYNLPGKWLQETKKQPSRLGFGQLVQSACVLLQGRELGLLWKERGTKIRTEQMSCAELKGLPVSLRLGDYDSYDKKDQNTEKTEYDTFKNGSYYRPTHMCHALVSFVTVFWFSLQNHALWWISIFFCGGSELFPWRIRSWVWKRVESKAKFAGQFQCDSSWGPVISDKHSAKILL